MSWRRGVVRQRARAGVVWWLALAAQGGAPLPHPLLFLCPRRRLPAQRRQGAHERRRWRLDAARREGPSSPLPPPSTSSSGAATAGSTRVVAAAAGCCQEGGFVRWWLTKDGGWRRKGCIGCGDWEKRGHVRPVVFKLCAFPSPYMLVCAGPAWRWILEGCICKILLLMLDMTQKRWHSP